MQVLYTGTNIFDIPITNDGCEAICVTTNGVIKNDGTAVMGKGIAKEANDRYAVASILAEHLRNGGNHVYPLKNIQENGKSFLLCSFPTKNNWRDDSDIDLIKQSAAELMQLCDAYNIKRCYLTPPGCANGHLSWEYHVYPAICNILDDRVTIVIRG